MMIKINFACFSHYHRQVGCLAADKAHLIEDQSNCLRPSLAFSLKSAERNWRKTT